MRTFAVLIYFLTVWPAIAQNVSGPPAPQNPLPMPFQRSGNPFILPAGVAIRNYMINQPDGTHSYRGVNPCMSADVRIKTVKPIGTVVTKPVTYNGQTVPNVVEITSSVDSPIDQFTGTLFMSRAPETLGSTDNLVVGSTRAVSIMVTEVPDWPDPKPDMSTLVCPFNLGYGNGGGG